MTKIALITGATSGIGKACAHKFAAEGYDLIITGRRQDRLTVISKKLEEEHGNHVLPICFDVRDDKAVKTALGDLPEPWNKISVLINNAGLASGLDLIQDGDTEDWNKMIDTNVKGLLYVTKSIVPYLKSSGHGHIINVGSTAGKEVYRLGGVYCASKHAVDALSKAMRIDLLQDGVKVTQICPGAAETEFSIVRFHGDVERAKKVYDGYQPMSPEDIAHVTYFTTTLPPHLCVNDLVLTSLAQANSHYVHKK